MSIFAKYFLSTIPSNKSNAIMRKILTILFFISISLYNVKAVAQVDSDFSDFDKEKEEMFADFEEFRKDVHKEYDEYVQAMYAEYNEFISSIKGVWGKDNAAEDTKTNWVEYGKDLKSRSIVDFEKGKIEVEVVLDDADSKDPEAINKKLAGAIEDMLNSKGKTCPYKSKVDEQKPLSKKPILDGLVDYSNYNITTDKEDRKSSDATPKQQDKKTPPSPVVKGKELTQNSSNSGNSGVTKANKAINEQKEKDKKEIDNIVAFLESQAKKNVQPVKSNIASQPEAAKNVEKAKEISKKSTKEIAKAIAEQSTKSTNTIKGEDNKERKVIKIEMALVSDNLSKNAAIYKDYVEEYSKKFNIEQPLIYAVIEQESRFNPKAKSWVPAFGLMQLVPKSGALDAYRYVYKKDWIPTQSYLYVPQQNIELGTAYLRVLMNQFSKVTDPDCRRLCVIASYNTGAGNVSRAFTGNTNIKNAIPTINNYSYQQLYDHLTQKLNTDEARKYVSGVSKRREKYIK